MDEYKRFFKTRKIREIILNLLRVVPSRLMLKWQYKIKTGRALNFKNPIRFTEKIQLYKLNYRNKLLHMCVDKYLVREYVKSKGLDYILVPLLGYYNRVSDIDINSLPESFVVKTTNGGGGNNIFICADKTKLDLKALSKEISPTKYRSNTGGREWAYYGSKPGIIIEKLLFDSANKFDGINDYKFFCYNGCPRFIVVDTNRFLNHKRNFYDINWNNMHISSDHPNSESEIEKPKNLDIMLDIARVLSKDFPFVRVDLYNVNNKIYFGELTFYPWSGYVLFNPDSADELLGEPFDIRSFS